MSTVEEEPTPPVECSSRASPSPVRRRSTSHKPDGDIELAQSRSEQFMGSIAQQGQDGTFGKLLFQSFEKLVQIDLLGYNMVHETYF
jgi:hypothetical protein